MTAMRKAHKADRAVARRRANLQSLVIGGAILVLVGGALLWMLSGAGAAAPAVVRAARVGSVLSDFVLTDINGVTHHASDYRGQVLIINGWATWCPPCRAEMPDLHAFYLAHKADGVQLLAINSGEDRATVQSFINVQQFTFPVLLDPAGVLNRLGVSGLPTTIIVGRDGVVKYIHTGMITPEILQAAVAPLL
jgi:thiol-disulfide isomerase/thioredoxin